MLSWASKCSVFGLRNDDRFVYKRNWKKILRHKFDLVFLFSRLVGFGNNMICEVTIYLYTYLFVSVYWLMCIYAFVCVCLWCANVGVIWYMHSSFSFVCNALNFPCLERTTVRHSSENNSHSGFCALLLFYVFLFHIQL